MSTFESLKLREQIEQRTTKWYQRRRKLVTASESASVIPNRAEILARYYQDFPNAPKPKGSSLNPYCSKKEWFLRKTGDPRFKFTGNEATEFGQRYEPIAQALYETIKGTVIHEYGLIVSTEYDFIGASPDGVSEDNVMLEIKCPFVRDITGIPPIYYWIQMQQQMDVCDLEECDYFECKFIEYQDRAMYLADTDDSYFRGCFIRNTSKKCKYPPKSLARDSIAQDNWAVDNIIDAESEVVVRWRLHKFFITRVERRKQWFREMVIPYLEQAARLLEKPWIYKAFHAAIDEQDEQDEEQAAPDQSIKNEIDFSKNVVDEVDECLPDIC